MTVPLEARFYAADVLLQDGGMIHIRAIRPDDRERLQGLLHSMSDQAIYFRFFGPKRELSEAELDRLTGIDFVRHVALAAVLPPEPQAGSSGSDDREERIVGVGRYAVQGEGCAEVAFAVADAQQNRGIGSVLLRHTAAIARAAGLTTFVADVLAENMALHRGFLARNGFHPTVTVSRGVAHISFPLGAEEQE